MSKFSDFVDDLKDQAGLLAKDELKRLVSEGKADASEFVSRQAENLETWTVMLADGQLTPAGFRKLVKRMEVLGDLQALKLKVQAKASAQRLRDGIEDLVIEALFKLIEQLEDNDDVQTVTANFEISDAVLARLTA